MNDMKKLSNIFYRLLNRIIDFQINNNLFQNLELKKGQLVKYNWKAKIKIKSAIIDRINHVMEIRNYEHNNVVFLDGVSCDSFWVRKIYWWEN